MKLPAILIALICLCTQANTQGLNVALSPLQVLSQKVGHTNIKLSYSRPAMRGRTIFGELIPYNQKWRTGANRNSKIQFSKPIMIADTKIDAGTYAILTKPGEKNWEVYFYSDTTHWEVPKKWNDSLVAAQLTVPSQQLAQQVESMTFSLDNLKYDACTLSLSWEKTSVSIPIKLYTEEQLTKNINKVLNGPTASDYTSAAAYRLETGKDLEQGLEWINTAINTRRKASFYDFLVKAKLLAKMGKNSEAKAQAKRSMELATEQGYRYGQELVTNFLESIKHE